MGAPWDRHVGGDGGSAAARKGGRACHVRYTRQMAVNRSFTKFQKERRRQEKKAAKRQERSERRKQSADAPHGEGPPIDYDAHPEDQPGIVGFVEEVQGGS